MTNQEKNDQAARRIFIALVSALVGLGIWGMALETYKYLHCQ